MKWHSVRHTMSAAIYFSPAFKNVAVFKFYLDLSCCAPETLRSTKHQCYGEPIFDQKFFKLVSCRSYSATHQPCNDDDAHLAFLDNDVKVC